MNPKLINYTTDDIPYEAAYRAYTGISFDPERRAKSTQEEYIRVMGDIDAEFRDYLTPENRQEICDDLDYFRAGYVKRELAWLSAQSRCMSTMIAGPANFPARQMEKRNQTERKRLEEWLEFSKKTIDRLRSKYNPSEKTKQTIYSDDDDAVGKLKERIAGLEEHQTRMKAVNKILRNKKLTVDEKVLQCEPLKITKAAVIQMLTPERGYDIGFQQYSLTNNNANIRRLKQRLTGLEKTKALSTTEVMYGEVKVVDNIEDLRIQLFFPNKPDAKKRTQLKQHGFKWTPSVGAWQRKRSNDALWAVKRILGGTINEISDAYQ